MMGSAAFELLQYLIGYVADQNIGHVPTPLPADAIKMLAQMPVRLFEGFHHYAAF